MNLFSGPSLLLDLPPITAPAAREPLASVPGWFWGLELKPRGYGLILIDPPWLQQMYSEETGTKKAPQGKYDCMPLEDIQALPVGQLAAPNCFVVMWTLWNFVAPGWASDTIRRWGFEPKSGGAWFKVTKTGKTAMGTGYGFRGCCEPFLTGSIGAPKVRSHRERNGILTEVEVGAELELDALIGLLREHSRKPPEMHEALERMFPGVPKVEIFARQRRPGWAAWGNQVDFFQGEAA
ncbi:MT-A70 family methyltransferase [Azospirillum baldaniorum]|uniref:MT-A70 family methyltransferase n=1 Tax=Azospirillum baldaniorum TaxID=1064539 RepID=UPI001B3BBF62